MALVNIKNIEVLDNPTKFTNPFQFEITFECLEPGISDVLEWKLIYVGCATDESKDQELDSVLVGPVAVGTNKFVFQAPAPDSRLIPNHDLMEVTVILITCSYKEQEFIRVGYYVNNDYGANTQLTENPPAMVSIPHLCRNILANQPRLTRFQIKWTDQEAEAAPHAMEPLPANEYIEQLEDMDEQDMEDEEYDEGDEDEYDDEDDENFEDVDIENQENMRPNIKTFHQSGHSSMVFNKPIGGGFSQKVPAFGMHFGS